VTINKAARVDKYLIPRIDELFTSLAGGKAFNTQTGLFEYKTLPFSVASAPSIFQWVMENLLQGFLGCLYINNITRHHRQDHLENLT